MSIVKHINVFQSLYERGKLPSEFHTSTLMGGALNGKEYIWPRLDGSIKSLRLVPSYLDIEKHDFPFRLKTIDQYNWGYSIDLRDFGSVEDYLSAQFKSKPRSIIRRYIRRLETCFPITYKLYHGPMDEKTYIHIFDALHSMIRARFQERRETHKELWRWEALKQATYQKILRKEASLFVIYDDKKPVEISLNYHIGTVLFSSVSSYDLDYGKFGLGHVEIYKQLEWCLAHGYSLFEMGVGGMDYKRKWSNHIYRFSHWVVIPKRGRWIKWVGELEYLRVLTKEFLKSKKLNELRDRLQQAISGNQRSSSPSIDYTVQTLEKRPEEQLLGQYDRICLEETGVNKVIYGLLYNMEAARKDVTIYRIKKSGKKYLVEINAKWFSVQNILR